MPILNQIALCRRVATEYPAAVENLGDRLPLKELEDQLDLKAS